MLLRRRAPRHARRWARLSSVSRIALSLVLPVLGTLWLATEHPDGYSLASQQRSAPHTPRQGAVSQEPDRAARPPARPARRTVVKLGRKRLPVPPRVATVRAALRSVGVSVDADDRVRPALQARLRGRTQIVVQRVDVRRVSHAERLYFHEEVVETDELAEGERRVVREGREGELRIVERVVTVDGQERSRAEVDRTVVREPVDRLVEIGTGAAALPAEPPAPQPRPEPEQPAPTEPEPAPPVPDPTTPPEPDPEPEPHAPADPSPGPDPSSDATWDQLAACESGGNWSANTGNGYYGGLQFSEATWHRLGGAGLPHEHPRSTQIALARQLQAQAGWAPWPSCASELGWL